MTRSPENSKRTTVLIAEDDHDLRHALALVLADENYQVIQARDGAHALEILAEAADKGLPSPDVLLLDFHMPGLSGIGLLRVLRRFARVPPTVLMTAFPDRSVETFARSAGALRVLWKPVVPAEVCAAVAAALAVDVEGGARTTGGG